MAMSISTSYPQAWCALSCCGWSSHHPTTSLNLSGSAMFKPKATDSLIHCQSILAQVSVGEDLPDDYGNWLPQPGPDDRRRAGILLHPTSFGGPYGIGDLGDETFRFIDWLHGAGCSVWQVLPLVPPGRKTNEDGCPYAGQDANCGNTLLISLEELVKDGLLYKDELPKPIDAERVNFSLVADVKDPLIAKAATRLISSEGELKRQLENFCRDPNISSWLEDAAYFAAIDDSLSTLSWYDWPEPLRNRHLVALEDIYQLKKDFIEIFIAQQFLFQRQWQKVCNYARSRGIKIMGDMPIYVGYHSADVWANKNQFLLNRRGFPILVSGVPPDAFSETGQLWGRFDISYPYASSNSCLDANLNYPSSLFKTSYHTEIEVNKMSPDFIRVVFLYLSFNAILTSYHCKYHLIILLLLFSNYLSCYLHLLLLIKFLIAFIL